MMVDYQGKEIVIIGLGLTGRSCVDFFLARGITPRVMDTRQAPPDRDKLPGGIACHTGSLDNGWLQRADLIVVSPGVAVNHPALVQAAQRGVEIIGDIELFCREATAPIVAITGSNGKSTVTMLVGEMAKAASLKVGIGGNIGQPALTLLSHSAQLYVLELSSFQLETTFSLKAAAATILNITQDHQDRYPLGLSHYQAAKLKIYHNAQTCVFNADDVLTTPMKAAQKDAISFGIHRGDYHLIRYQKNLWLHATGENCVNCAEINLTGEHNYLNALVALALADAVNIPRIASLRALSAFPGLPHRFQLVHHHKGVRWINDSKATNVGSTVAALKGLQVKGTLWLLLGGDGKSADFSPLTFWLTGGNVRVYCFGRDAAMLARLCPDISVTTETLAQAMEMIAGQVQSGDVVLLSPACASVDQFLNYQQRGDCFSQLAKELT